MIKLNASYSKKVPVEDRDYSSQSYHCSVEIEIPDGTAPDQLRTRIRDTFSLVRDSVEAELHGEPAPPARLPAPRQAPDPRQFQQPRRQREQPASAKQLGYLRDIAVRRGMSLEELDHAAHMQFGADSIARLSREEASRLIDWLGSANTGQAA